MKHFCTCPVDKCPRNPRNHGKGCDSCIIDNLKKKKIPACFFGIVNEDMSDVTDYSVEGFVSYFHKHKGK